MLKKIIPQQYHYFLANIKNAIGKGYTKTFYSQFGEDIAVSTMLKKNNGFYVDVGAHHPKRYSNTYLLYKKGWRGINIDANPHTITLFNRARPEDRNICVGVGRRGELEYYSFSDPAVNTFIESEAEKWMGKNWITFLGKKSIPVRPLKDILTECGAIPVIDFLSIDVEGMDFDVLQSFDWTGPKPTLIAIESHMFDSRKPLEDAVYRFLVSKQGYRLEAHMGPSLIFKIMNQDA